MENTYEINRGTLAIIPVNTNLCQILEQEKEFYIHCNSTKIIDTSCKMFGSSYSGRHEGTKNMTGIRYKTPIIISESSEIIFFPTTSPTIKDCCWISLNNLKKYEKKDNYTTIYFENNKKVDINISYFTIENQIYKATMLESKLRKVKIS